MACVGSEQHLRFRWNDHMQHLSKVLTLQRLQEKFCDVTLVSEDGYLTKAHQVVLASSSTYFQRVLGEVRADQHPMIVLRGANLRELTCLLDYMYQGNTQIEQSLIESVLEVADLLEVKGLSRIRSNATLQKFITPLPAPPPQHQGESETPQGRQGSSDGVLPPQHTPEITPDDSCEPPPPQTSGIDLSMAKNEPWSPREGSSGVPAAPLPAPDAPGEGTDGVLLPLPQASRKKRKIESAGSEENLESASDPDWGRISSKVEERGGALPHPRTITLTSNTTAQGTGVLEVEEEVERSVEAGPLTITLTTGLGGGESRPLAPRTRPLLPQPSPSPHSSLKRVRRRLRVRRVDEGRRRWLARERRALFGSDNATNAAGTERPATRALERLRKRGSMAGHSTETARCDIPSGSCAGKANRFSTLVPPQSQSRGCARVPGEMREPPGVWVAPGESCAVGGGTVEKTCAVVESEGGEEESDDMRYPSISPLSLFTLPPPPPPRTKQTRTTLTLEQKVKVIEAFLEGKSQRQIAGLYGTGKTQVSGVIRRREEILAAYRETLLRGDRLSAQRRRRRGGYARLNQHLIQWYRHMATAAGARITAGMLRAKALQIAPQLGYHDFKASNGWLATFKANHNLKFSRPGRNTDAAAAASTPHDNTTQDNIRREGGDVAYVEEGETEGSCGGGPPQGPETEDDMAPGRATLDPCESPNDPGALLHPGIPTAGLPKPPQMVNSALGANLSAAYNLSRDLTRDLTRGGDPGPGDLSVMTSSPLTHPAAALTGRGVESAAAKPTEGPLGAYKSEEPLTYTYDHQNRMAEAAAAPPRPTEYNYTPYGFPGGYYGYHFLGQY